MEKTTVSCILNDAKQVVDRLNSKTSSEPVSQERMNGLQVQEEKPPSSKEIIFVKTPPLQENDSLTNTSSGYSSKEDAPNLNDVSPRSNSDEEKILSEVKELKQTPEELQLHMEEYLPISSTQEEDEIYYKEDPPTDEGYYMSLGSLPSNLQLQAYKNAMENIRGVKNTIRQLLHQFYEAIESTYLSKQDIENQQNYHKELFEMWIKWSMSQSENALGDPQLLEALTLDMSRNIALKLQSAFEDLMPKVQGLPSSLQDKLQQACYDMQELYNTFSLSNGFEDIDQYYLTQSQFKLTQAQGSIEKLFCFLEDSFPSGWIVGPLSASGNPIPKITCPKGKKS
ncbi:perilipin-3-like isoform X2 [Macrotis lagotis]